MLFVNLSRLFAITCVLFCTILSSKLYDAVPQRKRPWLKSRSAGVQKFNSISHNYSVAENTLQAIGLM